MFEGLCRATGIGSLPVADPAEAARIVFETAPDLPYWPQLPKRAKSEGMIEQAAEGFPGLVIADGRLIVRQDDAFFEAVDRLVAASEKGDADVYPGAAVSPAAAAGFRPFLDALAGGGGPPDGNGSVQAREPRQAKGQIAGPITVGLAVLGEDGKPILYDPVLSDLLVRHISLKASWQARRISEAGAEPIIFVDEPVLACFGTPTLSWDAARVRAILDPIYSSAGFPFGTHCCSNTDWSILFESRVSVISFDACGFAETFFIYRDALRAFLDRGGNIAWGIVPTDFGGPDGADPGALADRLFALVRRAASAAGVPERDILRRSLVTPACGLGTRSPETAAMVLGAALEVSRIARGSL